MNIYLISQICNRGNHSFEGAVVAASSEYEARHMHPNGTLVWSDMLFGWVYPGTEENPKANTYGCGGWVPIGSVRCEMVGKAPEDAKKGVILTAYNFYQD